MELWKLGNSIARNIWPIISVGLAVMLLILFKTTSDIQELDSNVCRDVCKQLDVQFLAYTPGGCACQIDPVDYALNEGDLSLHSDKRYILFRGDK